jgi:hypothetical protein
MNGAHLYQYQTRIEVKTDAKSKYPNRYNVAMYNIFQIMSMRNFLHNLPLEIGNG